MTPSAPHLSGNGHLDAALALADAGYAVVPTRVDGTKAPMGLWKEYQEARPTPDMLRRWYSQNPALGVGIITGHPDARVILLEIEGRAMHRLSEIIDLVNASGLGDLWARLQLGWTERSPSSGIHWMLRVDDADEIPAPAKVATRPSTPEELAANPKQKWQTLAEVKGAGGYCIVAPTGGIVHPDGGAWTRIIGDHTSPTTVAVDELEQITAVIAAVLDEKPSVEPTLRASTTQQRDDGRLKPGDDFEARTDWADILEPHGWQFVYAQGRTRFWRRPGKTVGISATTGHAEDRDRLYVFTSSTEFDTETPYTKFGAHALLNHGGDYSAAARDLGRQGYGDKPQLAEVIEFARHQSIAEAVAEAPGEESTPAAAAPAPQPLEQARAADPAPLAEPVDPVEQRVQERTAQLLIDHEAKKRLAALTIPPREHLPLWVDNADILAGGHEPITPTVGLRLPSGGRLFYAATVNGIVGDPAAAKTLLATANCIDQLHEDPTSTVAWFDLDHNGAPALLTRYRRWGLRHDDVVDRIRLTLPEDSAQLLDAVDELVENPATIVVIDSIGELLPMFGASSNDADEYTGVHQQVMKRLASAGSAVITIDHLSKGEGSRSYGATGTIAKKRAYDGALLRASVEQPFTPGTGGASEIRILKDRHGGLLQHAVGGGREPLLGMWTLTERENHATHWSMGAGESGSIADAIADVDAVAELDPPAKSYRDVKTRLGWRDERAQDAWRSYRELRAGGALR